MDIPQFVHKFPCRWTFWIVSILDIMNKPFINIHLHVFLWTSFMLSVYLTSLKTTNYFLNICTSCLTSSHLTLWVFNSEQSSRHVMFLCFNLCFLDESWCQTSFICLLVIFISNFLKCLFKPYAIFSSWLCGFLLSCCKLSSSILNTSPTYLLYGIFLQSVAAAAMSLQLCSTLSGHMDCSLPGFSVHGIFQVRVLEWGAIAVFFPPV